MHSGLWAMQSLSAGVLVGIALSACAEETTSGVRPNVVVLTGGNGGNSSVDTAPNFAPPLTNGRPSTNASNSVDPAFVELIAAHNAVRATASPRPATPLAPLQWSAEAAATARAWAGNCRFEHNPNASNLGENIYAGSSAASVREVMTTWADEARSYTYASNLCSGVCGHYTQVVWAQTTHVGCAKQVCSRNSPFGNGSWEFWVCDYSPPGNWMGQRPY